MLSMCTSSGPSASRSVRELAHAPREERVLTNARRTVGLDGAIDHAQRDVGSDHLDHRDLRARGLVPDRIHHVSGFQRQQSRLLDLHARSGDVGANGALFGDLFAEGDARLHALAHRFERTLGDADQAHAVMNAARAQTALRDLEAASFAEQHVRNGHAHVFETDFAVAVRRVIVAEDGEQSLDLHAGRVHRNQHHRLLLVARGATGSVLPMKIEILQRGSPAPDDHHLRPLIT